MLRHLLFLLCLLSPFIQASAATQTKEVAINESLLKKIKQLKPDSSNAYKLEVLLGPPAACLSINPQSQESWICQWKGTLDSNRLENTLNISFESGMISGIQALDKNGKLLKLKSSN